MDALCQNDRRAWRRFAVPLDGMLFGPSGAAWRCEVLELSAGGARVQARGFPAGTATVTLYMAPLGYLEAEVLDGADESPRLRFTGGEARRHQVSQFLAQMAEDGRARPSRPRRRPRMAITSLSFIRPDGETVPCDTLDLSYQGISLRAPVRPPVGECVTIGGCRGRVVRHHDQGIVVQFGQPPADTALRLAAYRAPIPPQG